MKERLFGNILKLSIAITFLLLVFSLTQVSLPPQLTGRAVSINTSGVVNLTIASTLLVNLSQSLDFGIGRVTTAGAYCTLDSYNGTSDGCTGFSFTNQSGFKIENLGNTNANVSFANTKSNSEILSGTNPGAPAYAYRLGDYTHGNSCSTTGDVTLEAYNDLTISGGVSSVVLCKNLTTGTNHTLNLDFRLKIPSDVSNSTKYDTITISVVAA